MKPTCRNGHPRVDYYVDSKGRIICRICVRDSQRKYREQQTGSLHVGHAVTSPRGSYGSDSEA